MESLTKKTITINIDLNAALTGFGSARIATPAHHRVMKYYASPLLMGPRPSDDLLALIMHIFTEDEADLVQYLPPLHPRSAKKVAALSGRSVSDVAKILDNLAFTKFVILASGEPRKYTILPIVPGVFEMALMTPDLATRNTWHRTFAELFERLWDKGLLMTEYIPHSRPGIRYLPVNGISKTLHAAWPSDKFAEVLEPYNEFAVGNCQCRLAMHLVGKGCDRPLENCVAMGPIATQIIDRGLMRKADRQEILEKKRQAEEQGCVTFIINDTDSKRVGNGSCSCCGCCCHAMRSINQLNTPGMICKPHFLPLRDQAKCTSCQQCVRACPMSAWLVKKECESTAFADLQFQPIRCIGCGLCVLTCKFGALALQENKNVKPSQDGWLPVLLKLAPAYLSNTVRVWAKRMF